MPLMAKKQRSGACASAVVNHLCRSFSILASRTTPQVAFCSSALLDSSIA
jgi:hypothetical protein